MWCNSCIYGGILNHFLLHESLKRIGWTNLGLWWLNWAAFWSSHLSSWSPITSQWLFQFSTLESVPTWAEDKLNCFQSELSKVEQFCGSGSKLIQFVVSHISSQPASPTHQSSTTLSTLSDMSWSVSWEMSSCWSSCYQTGDSQIFLMFNEAVSVVGSHTWDTKSLATTN